MLSRKLHLTENRSMLEEGRRIKNFHKVKGLQKEPQIAGKNWRVTNAKFFLNTQNCHLLPKVKNDLE